MKILAEALLIIALFTFPNLAAAQTTASTVEIAESEVEQFMVMAFKGMKVINFGASCPGPGIIAARFVAGEIDLETAKRDMIPAILRDKSSMMGTVMAGKALSDSYEIKLTKPAIVQQEQLDELVDFALAYLRDN